MAVKICVAGQGAFGQKHLDALKRIPEVEITSLVGGNQDATAEVAKKYGIPHWTGELSEGIKRADAVILTTPTKMHRSQGEQVMRAGRNVSPTASRIPNAWCGPRRRPASSPWRAMCGVSTPATNGFTSGSRRAS
jgi:hypothetical protein